MVAEGSRGTVGIVRSTQRTGGFAVLVQCWDIQRHLGMREPVRGFGRLIAEMPDGDDRVTMAARRVTS